MGAATPAELALQSEIRQLGERIAELENQVSAIYESAPVGLCILDTDLRFVRVNTRFAEANGWPAAAHIGKTPGELNPDMGPVAEKALRRVLETGEPVLDLEVRGVTTAAPGITRIWIEQWIPLKNGNGDIIGVSISAEEVTDRKRAAALASMPDAVFIADAQGRFIHTNDAFVTYHRFRNREECSKTFASCPDVLNVFLSDGSPAPPDMWAVSRALRGETVNNTEYTLQRRDTGETWVGRYSFAPIRGDDGAIVGAVVVARDVTEHKRAEEQISRSQRTFSELVERAPFGIYVVDSQFRIAHMNAGSQDGAFRNVRPAIGRDFAEAMRILWPEPVAAEIIAVFRHTLETGEPYYSPPFFNPRHDVEAVEGYEWELHRMTLPDGQHGVICYYFDSTKLRQAEEALRQSEDRFRLALKNTPVSVAAQDRDLRYIWAYNQRSASPDQIIGRLDDVIFTAGEAARITAFKRRVLEEGIEQREPMWLDRPNGRVYLDICWEPIRDPVGRIVGVASATVDLTPIKLAEEALRRSEARWNAAIESFAEGAIIAAEDERVIYWNPAAQAMHGFTSPDEGIEPLEKTPITFQLWTPDGSRMLELNEWPMRRIKRGETVRNLELRIRRPDQGWQKVFSYSGAMVDTASGERLIFLTCHDLTELRKVEQALRESEEKFRAQVTASSEVVYRMNPDWSEMRQLRGRDFIADTGSPRRAWLQKYIHPDDQPTVRAAIDEAIRTKSIFELEHRVLRVDGTLGWTFSRAIPMQGANGEIVEWLGSASDISKRKHAEEALRESEERLRLAQIRGAVGVWDWNCRTGALHFTPELEQLYGLEPGSIKTYEDWRRLAHPDDITTVEAERDRAIANREPFDLEFRILHASGAVPWLAARGGALYDDTGKAVRVLGVNLDITQRKHAEEALAEAMQRLNAHMDNSPLAVIEFDPEFRVTRWSKEAEKVFGWTGKEILGRAIAELRWVHEDDVEAVARVSQDMLTGKRPRNVGMSKNYRKDGSTVECEWYNSAIYDAGGKLTSILSQVLDVTDRRRAEEAVRNSRKQLQEIIDGSPGIVFVKDLEGRFIRANQTFERFLGVTREELRGKTDYDLITRERAEYYRERDRRVAETGEPIQIEEVADLADGRQHVFLANKFPLRDTSGKIYAVCAISTDITERKQAEERLRQSQKLESLGLLAGGVAHDFNNLLVGIVGNASLAQDMLPPDHPVADLLAGVLKSGEQAAHLTRQMLAYSGKGKFVVVPLDLSALIPEMSDLVRPSIPKKINLRFDLEEELPAIEADRGQIQQVFMNLALNAADAIGSQEGLITVSTGVQDVDESYMKLHPELAALAPGRYVYLEVRDTGCGMDEATKAKIFDPFFSTKFVGRGLGLAAVSGILRGHGSGITVSSAPGKGSCFTVLFPAATSTAGKGTVAAHGTSLQGAGTVLVVDDERMVLEMAKRALERHGYEVLMADSGLAAIDVFRRHPGVIDLVVLDLSMPHMNGEEALPELRKIRPEVKVVVSSGYGESEAMPLFQGQRVSGFVQKPYTAKGIAEKVKACLASGSLLRLF